MTIDEILSVVEEEGFNVTLSGGDPLFSPDKTESLVRKLVDNGRKVWIYTGYIWESILNRAELRKAVELAEVVVDGPFIEKFKDPDLLFRGSSNQRLIDVMKSLSSNGTIIYKS